MVEGSRGLAAYLEHRPLWVMLLELGKKGICLFFGVWAEEKLLAW
jgi:hypothetical protein